MTQQYTPVTWQDETTSQQGTLINAERLNQMQTAHHYADGWEEVDAVPTADPSVAYHKVVYCTADSTFYRWDGTEWTKDVDDETKALLQQEIARATAAEGELAQDIADEETARETADTAMQADITALESGKLDKKTTAPNQTQVYAVRGSTQRMITVGYGPSEIPEYNLETVLFSKMPTLNDPTDETVVNYGWTTGQIGAEATARAEADTLLGNRITAEETRATQAEQANAQAIANTYTKAEADTLLSAKADKATTLAGYGIADAYTKSETDTLLALKANDNAVVHLAGAETIPGAKTFTSAPILSHDDDNVNLQNPNFTIGTTPSSTKWATLNYTDSTNTRHGMIAVGTSSLGNSEMRFRVYDYNHAHNAVMGLFSSASGDTYLTAPTRTYDASHTSDAVTVGLLKDSVVRIGTATADSDTASAVNISYVSQTGDSAPNNLVHRSGNESINGTKTVIDRLNANFLARNKVYCNTNWTKIIEVGIKSSSWTGLMMNIMSLKDGSHDGIVKFRCTGTITDATLYKVSGGVNFTATRFKLGYKLDEGSTTKGVIEIWASWESGGAFATILDMGLGNGNFGSTTNNWFFNSATQSSEPDWANDYDGVIVGVDP